MIVKKCKKTHHTPTIQTPAKQAKSLICF